MKHLPLVLLVLAAPAAAQETRLDDKPRIAVISAFAPELEALAARTEVERTVSVNGIPFRLGRLADDDVVVLPSGVSMVNAAMTTQLVLDRFEIEAILVSGIAGGVNPSLRIGDVTVPERWGQYLEVVFARETPEGYRLPPFLEPTEFAPYGAMHPQTVNVRSAAKPEGEERFWFEVDPAMLAAARDLAGELELERCAADGECLSRAPRLEVGGNGVSGPAFVDNAAFREHVFRTFEANVLDMETAAIAHVAHANGVPFLAFRSLSDLAGGGEGENEMGTFFRLAADSAAATVQAFLERWEPR